MRTSLAGAPISEPCGNISCTTPAVVSPRGIASKAERIINRRLSGLGVTLICQIVGTAVSPRSAKGSVVPETGTKPG